MDFQEPYTSNPSFMPTTAPSNPDHAVDHEFGAANTLLLVVLLMACILAGYVIEQKRFVYLPESGASMLLGMVAGGLIKVVVKNEDELELLQFNPLIFFFVLLPPIIFEAGYTLKKKRFFSNISAIGLYAVVGTFISTFVVGTLTYLFALIGMIGIETDSMLQALLFGSLISSVDPVATLAILGSSGSNCDPELYSLVFGESVLNDAVAIVLFHVMNSYASEGSVFRTSDILAVLIQFLGMTLASVIIGVSAGLLCSFVFKISNLHKHRAYEIQLLFLFSFGCFALAELVNMSGVVALFFCAVTLAHYNYYNLSVQTQISSRYVFEGMAKTSETVVFAYMGMSIFTSKSAWSVSFVILGILFCIVGRACNVFPMSWLANLCRTNKIDYKMQSFMFFSGLRGAVSYALSTQLNKGTGSAYGIEIIQTTTLGIVVFTTFFLGGTTAPMLSYLDLKRNRASRTGSDQLRETFEAYHELPRSPEEPLIDDHFNGAPPTPMIRAQRQALSVWRRFDINYMRPLFGGKGYQKSHITPAMFNAIQGNSTSERLPSLHILRENVQRSPVTNYPSDDGEDVDVDLAYIGTQNFHDSFDDDEDEDRLEIEMRTGSGSNLYSPPSSTSQSLNNQS